MPHIGWLLGSAGSKSNLLNTYQHLCIFIYILLSWKSRKASVWQNYLSEIETDSEILDFRRVDPTYFFQKSILTEALDDTPTFEVP